MQISAVEMPLFGGLNAKSCPKKEIKNAIGILLNFIASNGLVANPSKTVFMMLNGGRGKEEEIN